MCGSGVTELKASDCYPGLERCALEYTELIVPICVSNVGWNNRKALGIDLGEGKIQMA